MKNIQSLFWIFLIATMGNNHKLIAQSQNNPISKEVHTFNLKVLLEGPYNGTDMNTLLFDNGLLPANQPYNIAPWLYEGTEILNVNPGDDVVDWVLVEFMESPYGPESASPDRIINTVAALLMADGSIVQTDGISQLEFEADIQHELYVIVRHRNHLAVLSSNPLTALKGSFAYDFSDANSKAYLNGHKEIATGIFGMISGDCDANGIIEIADKDVCWSPEAGNTGYLPGDWNLDLQINNPDKDETWFVNMGLESKVPKAFECGDLFTDFRDDQTYNTVLIGDQCWMAKNLNIGIRVDGITGQNNNSEIEKFCYDDIEAECDEYGGLYQWNEIMQYTGTPAAQGICPIGWHIPTDNEWKYLEGTVDGLYNVGDPIWNMDDCRGLDAGDNLKETGTIHWDPPNTGATDAYGFTALPGGYFEPSYGFDGKHYLGAFWTSINLIYDYINGPIARALESGIATSCLAFIDDLENNNGGLSVRCVRYQEETNLPPNPPQSPIPENDACGQLLNLILNWTGSDPDGNPLIYDVFFGTETDPPLLYAGLPITDPDVSGLEENTTYYWKVRVHDDHGNMTEGPVWQFYTGWCCGVPITDDRDGTIYNTSPIEEQCWMAENLNIGIMIDGSGNQTNDGEIEKYCFNNVIDSCDKYGGFYQWNEMMDYSITPGVQGICPDGWYIPTDDDWKYLEGTVDSLYPVGDPIWDTPEWRGYNVAKNLKATYGWYGGGNGPDPFGFSALASGYRQWPGNFVYAAAEAHFHTSTQYSSNLTYWRYLSWAHDDINRHINTKQWGLSVRCIKVNEPPSLPENINPLNGASDQPVNIELLWNCYDPDNDPLTFDIYFGTATDPPLFTSDITTNNYDPGLLNYGITYYWKIVAKDDQENITTGPIWSFTTEFTCGDGLFDIRDGQTYNTVLIGTQCWMAENLDIGNVLPGSIMQTNNGEIEKYCYNNNLNNCIIYGGLYQWNEMMQYSVFPPFQGICPTSWHIGTMSEWQTLTTYLGGTGVAGGKMKEAEYLHWLSPNTGATNESGFTALPGGNRFYGTGAFMELQTDCYFWTSENQSSNFAFLLNLSHINPIVTYSYNYKNYGYSIRCVKD